MRKMLTITILSLALLGCPSAANQAINILQTATDSTDHIIHVGNQQQMAACLAQFPNGSKGYSDCYAGRRAITAKWLEVKAMVVDAINAAIYAVDKANPDGGVTEWIQAIRDGLCKLAKLLRDLRPIIGADLDSVLARLQTIKEVACP